jgi:ABC-type multidrug transport system permease subunit
MKRYNPIWELTLSRLRQTHREPEVVFWIYGFPLLLAIGLGIAFRNRGPEQIDIDVVAQDRAQEIVDRVLIPGDPVEYRFDPTRPESANARMKLDDAMQRAAGRTDAVAVRDKQVTEPGARYIDFLIPGLLGMNLMGGGLWGIGFVTVDLRVRKLLKRLVATPMKKSDFLLSLMASRMAFMVPEVILLLVCGWLFFDVPIRGNWLAIGFVCLLGALTFAGLGLFVACRADKIETVSGLMNLVMLPMWLFSGIFFSAERFPDYLQPFVQTLPLTQLNNALRAVILEGAPLASQPWALLNLTLFAGLSFFLALKWFKWA